MDSHADVLTEGVVVGSVVGSDCTSNVMVDVDSVNDDVLANLEGDTPAARSLSQSDKGFSLGHSTHAVFDVSTELSSNSSDFPDSSDVLVSGEIGDGSLDLSDESLGIPDALESHIEALKDSIEESIHKRLDIVLKEIADLDTNDGILHCVADVLAHGVVVSTVVGRDGTSDVVVDVNSVNKDILADLEGDVPGGSVVVEGFKLLGKLLCLGAGA